MARGSQSRRGSLIEAWANIVIGFGINFAANVMILPHFGFNATMGTLGIIGLIYTVISLVRSYCIRRWFNGSTVRWFR